ncbi:uncharacterized protein LOC130645247 isoform X1 [Hydractinia symbiolongicarpus]|uniref:uncharacterized protein LOC130645247 isoform X1 n=1 Tax=Hydractinia symbiolongicarpus TaxID=13093 RepID=UPI00254A3779|nr:uncharacterized protein LOC130645247 isoform X1 [Hydractinia symbiolongicarpus]
MPQQRFFKTSSQEAEFRKEVESQKWVPEKKTPTVVLKEAAKSNTSGFKKRDLTPCDDDENYDSFHAVMLGKSVQQQKTKVIEKVKDASLTAETMNAIVTSQEPRNVIYDPVSQPAIISHANTTKSLKLEQRKPIIKKDVHVPKRIKKIQKEETRKLNRKVSPHTRCSSMETTEFSTDVSKSVVDRLKSFARMDEEFFDIISQMDKGNQLTANKIETVNNKGKEINKNINTLFDEKFSDDLSINFVPGRRQSSPIMKVSSENFVARDSINKHSEVATSKIENKSQNKPSNGILNTDIVHLNSIHTSSQKQSCSVEVTAKEIDRKTNILYSTLSKDAVKDKEISAKSCNTASICHQTQSCKAGLDSGMTLSSCIHDLFDIDATLKKDVQYEDIVNITASKAAIIDKPTVNPVNGKLFVSKESLHQMSLNKKPLVRLAPTLNSTNHKTVHHFCTAHPNATIKQKINVHSLFSHTPAKYNVLKTVQKLAFPSSPSHLQPHSISTSCLEDDKSEIYSKEEDKRLSLIADKIINEIETKSNDNVSEPSPIAAEKKFMKLQDIVDQIFEENDSFDGSLVGQKIELNVGNSRFFNVAGPPKLHLEPAEVTNTLAPQYVSLLNEKNEVISDDDIQDELIENLNDSEVFEELSNSEREHKLRVLNRQHHSAQDLRQMESDSEDDEMEDENAEDGLIGKFESVLDMQRRRNKTRPDSASECSDNMKNTYLERRCHSQPSVIVGKSTEKLTFLSNYNSVMKETQDLSNQLQALNMELKNEYKEPAQGSMVDNKNDIPCTQSSKIKTKIWNNINENSNKLQRSTSLPSFAVSNRVRTLIRAKSETALHHAVAFFDNANNVQSQRDLVFLLKEKYWYQWIDEQYALDTMSEEDSDIQTSRSASAVPSVYEIDFIPTKDGSLIKLLQEEISILTKRIDTLNDTSGLLGFLLCRRGALYKKAGELKNALIDLNRSIELEPKLVDAYWHRHLVLRIQGDTKKALEDLNRVTTLNHNHSFAFRSSAEIYKEKGDIELAISSYSQAIHIEPSNTELLYLRAELLEQRGDIMLALEDYKSANKLEPTNTTALYKIGTYHFNIGSWMAAIKDFTEFLSKQPKNADVYFLRGRAFTKLLRYKEAITDLSVSIHLKPNNHLAFFHRGCLLRKCLPKQAVQDFSVSLLLDSTVANVSSYLHRGILYTELQRYEQASLDFEAAIRLDRKLAPAHVNLGVIEMNFKKNIPLAINRFNIAIRMDPTYIRAYMCRADAYERIGVIDSAITDYSRVIHMKPDETEFRVAKGRLLLKKKKHELASFLIRQCAVLSAWKKVSPTQQAVVEAFLGNFERAIGLLEVAIKSQPITPLHILLGKTKMKAKRYQDAIESFQQALDIMKPWNPKQCWPKEASQVYFMMGLCHVEEYAYQLAIGSFNCSLKIHPGFAEAYYQRELVKMKLGSSKGVHDFNRALACNPSFYQAFLCRALYYAMNKRYAKAIMNCNEAIKLEERSVQAYLYRGSIKYHMKSYDLAIKDLTKAISKDQSCALAYFNRAACYHQKKHYFKALKDYSIVLLSDISLRMKALLNRGLLYFEINDMENACDDFLTALDEDPRNAKIYHTLGLCYHRMGCVEKAVEAFTTSLECDPFFTNSLIGRGNALISCNNQQATISGRRDYSRALHMDPSCAEARVNLAHCLQLNAQHMKAWYLYTRTIELAPASKSALEGRALVNLRMQNTYGAFLDINNALKIGKSAELLTIRGVVNQCLGDNVSAMSDYQAAIKFNPSYGLSYYNAANLYFLHKQFEQAISYYNRTIDWDPSDAPAYVNRGTAKSIVKDETALQDFEIAASLAPNWSHIYFNRGNVYFSLRMHENADDDFTQALSLKPNDALLYKRRADVRGKMGRKEAALKDYRRAIDLKKT